MIQNTNYNLFNGSSVTLALAGANNNIDNLKLFWKKAFIAKTDVMFTNLGDAKMQQLFGMNGDFQVTNSTMFKNLLNNNETFKNNALKFIVNE